MCYWLVQEMRTLVRGHGPHIVDVVFLQVRLQTMPNPAAGEKPLYAGTFDCARQTVVKEGFRGLYKGQPSAEEQFHINTWKPNTKCNYVWISRWKPKFDA